MSLPLSVKSSVPNHESSTLFISSKPNRYSKSPALEHHQVRHLVFHAEETQKCRNVGKRHKYSVHGIEPIKSVG